MKSLHREMSWEEFENIPHRLGWKHEYYGDAIHLTPSKIAVVSFCLDLGPRQESGTLEVRSAGPDDAPALRQLFVDAFADTIDYADYPRPALRESASKSVGHFFASQQGAARAASCLAEEDGCLIGAALLIPSRRGPLLQPLFVRRSRQRQGVATALMNRAVNTLRAVGETHLYSRCHLGNEPSVAWHSRYGFRELPDAWIAAARAHHFDHELERHRRLGELREEELADLAQQADHWDAEWRRLTALESQDFWAAHPRLD